MNPPSTEAGWKLLNGHYPSGIPFKEQMREFLLRSILAIEKEAAGSRSNHCCCCLDHCRETGLEESEAPE